jgi:hypothetical protein
MRCQNSTMRTLIEAVQHTAYYMDQSTNQYAEDVSKTKPNYHSTISKSAVARAQSDLQELKYGLIHAN